MSGSIQEPTAIESQEDGVIDLRTTMITAVTGEDGVSRIATVPRDEPLSDDDLNQLTDSLAKARDHSIQTANEISERLDQDYIREARLCGEWED